jgi:hypothetical protein
LCGTAAEGNNDQGGGTHLAFWASIVGFPALVLLVGALLRAYRRAPQTCATDVLSLFIVFDGIIIGDTGQFQVFVDPHTASNLTWIAIFLAFTSIVTWTFCLLDLEPKVISFHTRPGYSKLMFPYYPWISAWGIGLALIIVHALLFTGRIII